MSSIYFFEKIDNPKGFKYTCVYKSNKFLFYEYPYFTTISTTYSNGAYDGAYSSSFDDYVTKSEIADVLNMSGIKVDLVVKGTEMGDLILPLTRIDDNYAYFSNNSLTLMVDTSGAVTEEEHNA